MPILFLALKVTESEYHKCHMVQDLCNYVLVESICNLRVLIIRRIGIVRIIVVSGYVVSERNNK